MIAPKLTAAARGVRNPFKAFAFHRAGQAIKKAIIPPQGG